MLNIKFQVARHESPSLCRAKRRRAAAKEARAEERRLRELALAAAKKPARRSTRIERIHRARFYANPSYPYRTFNFLRGVIIADL